MTMRSPLPEIRLSRRAKLSVSVIGTVIVLLILATSSVGVYTDWLWFGEVGYRDIFASIIGTRILLFLVFGLVVSLAIAANIVVAYILRPPFRPMSLEQQNLERYRIVVEPRKKLIVGAIFGLALISAGSSAQVHWQTWMLWRNGGSFGVKDAQFGKDVSFFAFDYPFYRLLLGFGFSAVIFSAIAAVAVHYLFGAVRLQTAGPKITVAARRHLTVLLLVFLLLKAAAYWLDRYGIVFSERSKFTGASYTDVNAALPAKTGLFFIALLIAGAVLASIWLRSSVLPAIALAGLMVVSLLANGLIPVLMQQFSVTPNANDKEAKYISRNIAATREAYGIVDADDGGSVNYVPYAGVATQSAADLPKDTATVSNIRILDPNVVSPAFTFQQQIQNFYGFTSPLDVDRYTTNGVTSDYVVGVRELDVDNFADNQNNWISKHTVYTHGYGMVAAQASSTIANKGDFAESNIPPTGFLGITQPRVYYGELMPDYSIVGAAGARENDGDKQTFSYDGDGGVSLSSLVNRLAFAVKYREASFVLNDAVSGGSKIIFDRDPRERAQKIAPFLTFDTDPYPVVSNGRIVWMLDAYTTMSNYPYAEHKALDDITTDSLSRDTGTQKDETINYIRNSVKVTVDAYDGTVNLYEWDESDPMLKAWMKSFPDLIKDKSEMPSELREHVRYPEDLFKVQRSLLELYHIDSPRDFYSETNKWTVPNDPASTTSVDQPPYYLLAAPADGSSTEPAYQLTSPMKVNSRPNLAAYISVISDNGPNYGKMTVLELPTDTQAQGPEQVYQKFNSEPVITQDISLFTSASAKVIHGNLLTLPVGGSFLYVEPLYLQSTKADSFPVLQRVLVLFKDKIGYGTTLAQALLNLTQDRVGQDIDTGSIVTPIDPDVQGGGTTGPTPTPSATTPAPTGTGSTGSTTIDGVLTQLSAAAKRLQQAYQSGDLAAIGQAQADLKRLSDQYLSLRVQQTAAPTPTPTSS
ncbi:MAG: conserved rane protein of unknown function [Jatrophihabitantaceae bacterium]|nr:conserved rane protein of unknown function [Jatrophihabitantaceae bacterium]